MPRPAKSQRSAAEFIPSNPTLPRMRAAVQQCEGCELYRNATQAVFGEGTSTARLVTIGETPGDAEDRAGKPFVGPAGKLLNDLFEEAGVARADVYVTNAVKHFKWMPTSGVRRLHTKPSAREIGACRPWLEAELAAIHPDVVVCLGATAAQTLLGRSFRITVRRGEVIPSPWAAHGLIATYHPAAVLRAPDPEARHAMRAEMLQDLRRARQLLSH